jgi:hypothetical protein
VVYFNHEREVNEMEISLYIVTGKVGKSKINCVLDIYLTREAAVNFIHSLEDNMPALLTIEHWVKDLSNDSLSAAYIESEDVYRIEGMTGLEYSWYELFGTRRSL